MAGEEEADGTGEADGAGAADGMGERAIAGSMAGAGPDPAPIEPGLHVVATPIGSARDITLRALDILAGADVIAAEDTRSLRRLMAIHGIATRGRPVLAYHDHSPPTVRSRLLAFLREGRSVALVSEAGTPLVADPGYRLVREAVEAGITVRAAPGASALLAALAVAGLPTDRFLFAGFLPSRPGPRAQRLAEVAAIPASLVFYESPNRLAASLSAMVEAFGAERPAAICRELTKRFEEVRRGPLGALADRAAAETPPRGEIVIVLGPPTAPETSAGTVDAALAEALTRLPLGRASAEVASRLGLERRAVYARALALRAGRAGDGEKEAE